MTNKHETKPFNAKVVAEPMAELGNGQAEPMVNIHNNYHILTVIEGRDFGAVFQLNKERMVIGRSSEADIQIDDMRSSRRHALLTHLDVFTKELKIAVTDLESKHGVYVNGMRVCEAELHHGDKLQIGDTVLKFEIKDQLDTIYGEKFYQQATRDPLTGLWNFIHARQELDKHCSLALRYERNFSLLLVEVNRLRAIKDNYGNSISNIILRTIAKIMESQLRAYDIAARYSHEGFIALLPETNAEGALIVAQRLRSIVMEMNFTRIGYPNPITISMGMAYFPICGNSGEALLREAEKALLRAHRKGGNKVCMAMPLLD